MLLTPKTGGPAAQAGVKKGDSIIKVNGTIVSKINHREVVQIIKCKYTHCRVTQRVCAVLCVRGVPGRCLFVGVIFSAWSAQGLEADWRVWKGESAPDLGVSFSGDKFLTGNVSQFFLRRGVRSDFP